MADDSVWCGAGSVAWETGKPAWSGQHNLFLLRRNNSGGDSWEVGARTDGWGQQGVCVWRPAVADCTEKLLHQPSI